jgi:hypothetical protein
MDKTKHPVDDLFSKGIEGFQMEPSPDIKKKVFASPAAITPIKPWFIGFNWMLITASVIATASLIFYFGFYNNSQLNNISDINNNVTANTTIQNDNKLTSSSVNDINFKSENNLVADGSTSLSLNTNEQPDETISENDKTNENKKTNTVIVEIKQNTNIKTQNAVVLNTPADVVNTEKKHQNNIVNANEQNISKNESNIENNTTANLLAEITSSKKSISENLETNISNTALSSNPNMIVSLSSGNNLNAEFDKSSILFLMDKRTIKLYSEQYTEYMKLLIEKPAHYIIGFWFAEIKAGLLNTRYNVTANNSEWKPAQEAKQNMLKPSMGYEFGANAVYQRNKLIFKAGFNYINYGEKLLGNLLLTNPYNSEQIDFVNNPYDVMVNGNYYNVDTLGSYVHYTYTQTDHIFASDSSTVQITQNILVDMYDTTNVTKFDTLPKTTINNCIRYFEIPLSVGYVFPMGRFNLALNANIAPGYLLAVRGWQMNTVDYPALEPYQKSTLRKFTLSAGVSFELGYMLNESITLIAEPYYKRSLLPIYSNQNNINQTNQNFGFRIGIRKIL